MAVKNPAPSDADGIVSEEPLAKRLKASHNVSSSAVEAATDPVSAFFPGTFDHNNIARHHTAYGSSAPFKHAVVEKLFNDDLLRKVKDECLNELSFSEKETDIYKINQTGDLASLNYLTPTQLSLLPNLLALRNALYSSEFRNFLRTVTGCGPLSGSKQDMSVAQYTKSCHLLNHDDVIGTRRVSYILYMPLPDYQVWQKDWGGALELYPTKPVVKAKENGSTNGSTDEELEPEPSPSKIIPPSWNQFVFFEVQPGRSFHCVEEVVVGDAQEDVRSRMSISGWFHAPQEGEEGYEQEAAQEMDVKSSREQLAMTQTVFTAYPASSPVPSPLDGSTALISEKDASFLSQFMNPVYLQSRTMTALAQRFVDTSSLDLHHFLKADLAEALEAKLRSCDDRDGLLNTGDRGRRGKVPPHESGISPPSSFVLKGPPHKHRYAVLTSSPSRAGTPPHSNGKSTSSPPPSLTSAIIHPLSAAPLNQILNTLQSTLFTSTAFRAWLTGVSRLVPLGHNVEARRFRPGLDYMLARSEEKEARLDVCLGLTPGADDAGRDGWTSGEWGGWECYMAPHDEEEDPAVYRSGSSKKPEKSVNGTNGTGQVNGKTNGHTANGDAQMNEAEAVAEDDESDADAEGEAEEDDSTLLTVQPGYNKLLLVLRDERVMRFVKYVSAAATGSRWDVYGEYEVGQMEVEGEDEESELA